MNIDISQLQVRRAISADDFSKVFSVRWQGYKKYFSDESQVVDGYDYADNCTLLLATDGDDNPVGTLRLLNSGLGSTEIESFISMKSLLEPYEMPFVEATRFSVPSHPLSREIKIALKKAFYLYCVANNIDTMLIWVRPSAAREHKSFLFVEAGEKGNFMHPLLGNVLHKTLKFGINEARVEWQRINHPLLAFMVEQEHSNLRFC